MIPATLDHESKLALRTPPGEGVVRSTASQCQSNFALPRRGMLLGAPLLAICTPRVTVLSATCAPFLSRLHSGRLRLGS